jgi:putative transposase
MPRQARLDMPGALHHIMVRGINKKAVFSDKEDKEQLLQRLGINLVDGQGFVYAWVVMDNHLHPRGALLL